jgi:uncharacterized protein YcfJ
MQAAPCRQVFVNVIWSHQTPCRRKRAISGPFASPSSMTYGDTKVGNVIDAGAKVSRAVRALAGSWVGHSLEGQDRS